MGLDDPSHLDLPEAEKLQAFHSTVQHIQRRFDAFFALNFEQLNVQELAKALEKIALIA